MTKKENNEKIEEVEFKSYARRWFVLLAVVFINISGAMIWLTFTPITYSASIYYDTTLDTINWCSLVFMITGVPMGVLATWTLETYGVRVALLISGWLTCAGGAVRIASAAESLPSEGRIAVLFVGQTLCALGQPFSMYAPAKTASAWFPENQRALANSVAAVANPVGVVIAGLISPIFQDEDGVTLYTMNLLITMAAPAAFAAVWTTVCVTSPIPKTPPSAGAIKKSELFGKGVKKALKNKNFLVLLLTVGGSIGLYSTFATLLEQLLCPWGYTSLHEEAGISSATLTGVGVVGAAAMGTYCDKTKQFSSALKLCFIVTLIGEIVFCVVFHIDMDYLILIIIGSIGLFSFGIFPIGVELGAECTYPVGIATTSGLIMISGQLQSAFLILVFPLLGREMSIQETIDSNSQCYGGENSNNIYTSPQPETTTLPYSTTGFVNPQPTYDLSLTLYLCAGYFGLLGIIVVAFFRPVYKRMAAEQHVDDVTETKDTLAPTYATYKSTGGR